MNTSVSQPEKDMGFAATVVAMCIAGAFLLLVGTAIYKAFTQ